MKRRRIIGYDKLMEYLKLGYTLKYSICTATSFIEVEKEFITIRYDSYIKAIKSGLLERKNLSNQYGINEYILKED